MSNAYKNPVVRWRRFCVKNTRAAVSALLAGVTGRSSCSLPLLFFKSNSIMTIVDVSAIASITSSPVGANPPARPRARPSFLSNRLR
ncbi:hypothetical protein BDR03DRAFT_953085, partial [Suillus americanus]